MSKISLKCSAEKYFLLLIIFVGKEELDYTQNTSFIHDIFGHMPLLTNTNFRILLSDVW